MTGTQQPEHMSTQQQRIAQLGQQYPERSFISLAHHMDMAWMYEAWRRTRKNGAVGVDGQTAAEYQHDLENNLRSLLDRAKSGRYRAPPVRRVHIPKGGGKTRPIGIPTLEDKLLQRAVAMVLEPLYEPLFSDSSYGFRPRRSAHDALHAFRSQATAMGGGWVIELDIQSFFDALDRQQLRTLLRQRVRDGVITRLIDKWLKAGVLEDGQLSHPQNGTPQGGVISPLLANIYLHEVLDQWFEDSVQPRLKGRSFMVRYADDAVLCFSNQSDAARVMDVLPKRFARYGLRLHPTKTKMVCFKPPCHTDSDGNNQSFDLLGFTHVWGRSRRGRWIIQQHTAKDRFSRSLRNMKLWLKMHRHQPVAWQHQKLIAKLRGHYAYYGISGNARQLKCMRYRVERLWIKWLSRRSQRAKIRWEQANRLLERYALPPARLRRARVT
ncbi:MAG: group II intron reverse transcriptase/maturase [Nitrosospira sp.]|nr:group II intron reverse transcriptase/maturase [Nitrosospira sp.]